MLNRAPCTDYAWLCWIEAHPGLAGYVQAVGAIVAILVSVQLARSSARREKEADAAAELRVQQAEAAATARAIEADRAAEARVERAKIDGHNAVIDRITALGVLATAECEDQIKQAEIDYAPNTGIIMGGFATRHLAELRQRLPEIKEQTHDTELMEAISELQDALVDQQVQGLGCAAYIAALREVLDRLYDALLNVDGQRKKA